MVSSVQCTHSVLYAFLCYTKGTKSVSAFYKIDWLDVVAGHLQQENRVLWLEISVQGVVKWAFSGICLKVLDEFLTGCSMLIYVCIHIKRCCTSLFIFVCVENCRHCV